MKYHFAVDCSRITSVTEGYHMVIMMIDNAVAAVLNGK